MTRVTQQKLCLESAIKTANAKVETCFFVLCAVANDW